MDEVDRQWIRFGSSALAAVVGGGIGLIAAAEYLTFICSTTNCGTEAVFMFGLLAAWAAVGAVAGGLWGWRRDVATGTVVALFLAFLALHFAWEATWNLYGPLLEVSLGVGRLLTADATGPMVAFLVYWTLAAAFGVAAVWQGVRAVEWLLARWEPEVIP